MSHNLPVAPMPGRVNGAIAALDASPNTPEPIAVPGTHAASTRPSYFEISFENSAGTALVRGRFLPTGDGAAADFGLDTFADADPEMGHVPMETRRYPVPTWATQIWVASNTASANALISWLYEI